MGKTYFVGVRFDKQLFNKLNDHSLNNSDLIRKSVKQYFRAGEPNRKIPEWDKTSFNNYDRDIVDLLNGQIQDLKQDKQYLQGQVNALMVSRYPRLLQPFINMVQRKQ